MSGPKWPLNQGPVLNDELVQYFNTLKEVRPNVTESLDNCMVHLTKSDPEYSGDRDESILIK